MSTPAPIRTALVPGREPGQRLEALGAERDARGGATPWPRGAGHSVWVADCATFRGAVVLLGDGGGRLLEATVGGAASFAVGAGRLVGILNPVDRRAPAVWLSWDLDVLTIDRGDAASWPPPGPRPLRLTGDGVELALATVVEVVGPRYRPDRGSRFVDALSRLSA